MWGGFSLAERGVLRAGACPHGPPSPVARTSPPCPCRGLRMKPASEGEGPPRGPTGFHRQPLAGALSGGHFRGSSWLLPPQELRARLVDGNCKFTGGRLLPRQAPGPASGRRGQPPAVCSPARARDSVASGHVACVPETDTRRPNGPSKRPPHWPSARGARPGLCPPSWTQRPGATEVHCLDVSCRVSGPRSLRRPGPCLSPPAGRRGSWGPALPPCSQPLARACALSPSPPTVSLTARKADFVQSHNV